MSPSAPGCARDDQSHPRTGGGAAVRPGPSTKIPSAVSSRAENLLKPAPMAAAPPQLTGTPRPTPSSRRLDRNLIAHHWPARAATGCPSETPPEDGGVDGPVRVPSWWLSPLQQHNTTSLPPPRSSPGPCASGTPLRWPRSTRSMPSPSVGARVGFYPWPLSLNARPTMHPTTLGNLRIAINSWSPASPRRH